MNNWMKMLGDHYRRARRQYPEEKLLILFDIDGTVLDMRQMILHLLKAYDRANDSHHATGLRLDEITVHENDIRPLLNRMDMTPAEQDELLQWFNQVVWSPLAVRVAHQPFQGVLEIIRWFQLQPNTHVGLNSGRSERLRADTLKNLNELGSAFKVHFSNSLLAMNSGQNTPKAIAAAKCAAISEYRRSGYRIVAMVDNEPANLAAIADSPDYDGFLLLHADTLFESQRTLLPNTTLTGKHYRLAELITADQLHTQPMPRHVEFVFQGIEETRVRDQFLQGSIFWGEVSIRLGEHSRMPELDVSATSQSSPVNARESWLELLQDITVSQRNHGLKIDLKQGGILLDKLLRDLRMAQLDQSQMWINAPMQRLHERGFTKLRQALPEAILQCPLDSLQAVISALPEQAGEILAELKNWGITRFSVDWSKGGPELVEALQSRGYEVNIHSMPDLDGFLRASLLLPNSISSRFSSDQWPAAQTAEAPADAHAA